MAGTNLSMCRGVIMQQTEQINNVQQAEQVTNGLMKYFTRLGKSKALWYLLGISFLFFLLRFPSFFEPDWHVDDGLFEAIGLALGKGQVLYVQISDNKPPLVYLLFALFHSELLTLHFVSLLFGLLTVLVFFFLSQKLFGKRQISMVTTSIFAFFFATPIFEGQVLHAENFMLLPIVTASYLIYAHSLSKTNQTGNRSRVYLMAGVLLGIALVFKIVAVFDFSAFLLYLLIINLPERPFLQKKEVFINVVKNIYPVLVGSLLPLFITFLYFFTQHTLKEFIQAAFFGNIDYVGGDNYLLIPQGTLLLKVLLLTVAVFLVFLKRKAFQPATIFILLWFSFSVFNALFSGRGFGHYLLLALPSISLVVGLFFATQNLKARTGIFLSLLIGLCLLVANFGLPNFRGTIGYYRYFLSFETGRIDRTFYYERAFGGIPTRNDEVAQFIKTHTTPSESVFVWGDYAQIYLLAGKQPPVKYWTAFQITYNEQILKETELALKRNPPKYIIMLTETPEPFPFDMTSYSKKFALNGATIYERIILTGTTSSSHREYIDDKADKLR